MIGTSFTFLPGWSFSNCVFIDARYLSMTRIWLSVDCLKEILTVSGSSPEPLLQAVRPVAAMSRVALRSTGAVGRTGTTSYGPPPAGLPSGAAR